MATLSKARDSSRASCRMPSRRTPSGAGTMEEGEAPATAGHHPPSDSSLGAFRGQWTSAVRVKGRPPFTRLFVIVWMHLELRLTGSEGFKNV